MVATISPADSQYHHTVNTLKYADRAKEIKTHIQVMLNIPFGEGIIHIPKNIRLGGFMRVIYVCFMQYVLLLCIIIKCIIIFYFFQKNIGTIDTHVSDYQRMIDSLQVNVLMIFH